MATSSIEWCTDVWNPVIGCTPVSPGCLNCYAATMARRLEAMGKAEYAPSGGIRIAEVRGGRAVFTGEVRTLPHRLTDPLHWKKPRRVFVNSMSDLFHEAVPFEFIDRVFAVMALCRRHTFQALTKRPERMAEYLASRSKSSKFWEEACPVGWTMRWTDHRGESHPLCPFPLPNVWAGTSVENQATANERIPHLQKCPAAVRFLSVEPQVGPIVYRDEWANGLHWAIGGGESGPRARPYDVSWARTGIAWARKHGVAWFQKQVGAKPIDDESDEESARCEKCGHVDLLQCFDVLGADEGNLFCNKCGAEGKHEWGRLRDRKGGDPAEWPEDLRVRELPPC